LIVTSENPHAGQGAVVLDIGGDVGALIVSAPEALLGAEIEICPAGRRSGPPDEGGDWWDGQWRHDHHHHHHGHAAWPHVAVLARPSPVGTEPAAVFPGLREGDYDLWLAPDGPTVLTVSVRGGAVTTAAWPGRFRP
jgi:hypothetical protein